MNYLPESIEFKLRQMNKFDGANVQTVNNVLTFWSVIGVPEPDLPTQQAWCDEYVTTGLPVAMFNITKFNADLWDAFVSGAIAFGVRNERANIVQFAQEKNFTGMKQYANLLLANGIISQSDLNALKAVLLLQGINLDSY